MQWCFSCLLSSKRSLRAPSLPGREICFIIMVHSSKLAHFRSAVNVNNFNNSRQQQTYSQPPPA